MGDRLHEGSSEKGAGARRWGGIGGSEKRKQKKGLLRLFPIISRLNFRFTNHFKDYSRTKPGPRLNQLALTLMQS
jgi:hypothetical protein